MNLANGTMNGSQVSGFMNVTSRNGYGNQVAGFMNRAKDLKGVQVAGFLNSGKKVQGSQIGVFNFADSVSGVQVGFFNFSRKGYRRVEVFTTDIMQANVSFKTGTKHLHNIFTMGFSPFENSSRWSYGYGFGSELPWANISISTWT